MERHTLPLEVLRDPGDIANEFWLGFRLYDTLPLEVLRDPVCGAGESLSLRGGVRGGVWHGELFGVSVPFPFA